MANESIIKYGTEKTLEANGGSCANNAIVQADDANYGTNADGADYPDADFVLTCAFSVAPTENSALELWARELDISSTNDAEAPEASAFREDFICAFPLNNVTTTQYIKRYAQDVPKLAAYYLFNNGTGQTLSSGWTLKVTPRTLGPAA